MKKVKGILYFAIRARRRVTGVAPPTDKLGAKYGVGGQR